MTSNKGEGAGAPGGPVANEALPSLREQVAALLDDFNFEEVRAAMAALAWHWSTEDGGHEAPDIARLRKQAEEVLMQIATASDGTYSVEMGGFVATLRKGLLRLSFEVTSSDAMDIFQLYD